MSRSAFEATYRQLHSVEPPETITRGESDAAILSPSRGFMTGFDYTLQLQVGCPGGCLFCYVPSGGRLTPADVRGPDGQHWGFVLRAKRDPIARLQASLLRGELADKTIYWSGVTDPYTSPPATTRALWETLAATPAALRPRRIAVQTRYRADRDADAMATYAQATTPADGGPAVVISFSVGTDREDLIAAWERATPSFAHRRQAIAVLRRAGLSVVATLSPFGLWRDLTGTLEEFKAGGVAYITVLFFKEGTASANTPRRFRAYLRQEYPQLFDPIWQAERLEEIQAVFGHDRVLVGQAGFTSLGAPHLVGTSAQARIDLAAKENA